MNLTKLILYFIIILIIIIFLITDLINKLFLSNIIC